jgi:predicted ATPase/DNA-binding XRE family transcriptional regulator
MAAANRPPDAPAFGETLRELRIAAGLTQEDLAERTGLSVRGISDLERGARKSPQFQTVRLLADALEVASESRAALVAAARPTAGAVPEPSAPAIEVANSLPVPATRLIGREQEVEEVVALLDRGEMRLLTLTGPGGVGKTRLALEVVLRSVDAENAVFVDLAPISEPAMVATTIVRALGLRDAGDRAPAEVLKTALKERHVLFLFDNFEQVIAAGSLVADLLANCPKLKILVTSRIALRLKGEQLYPVPPLATPDSIKRLTAAELEESPAVTLFVQRARAADPHFSLDDSSAQSVAEICQWLDGLPLAIELAAARVKLLPPDVLLNLIKRRLSLLASGPQDAPERQQAMRNTLDWSYDLLSGEAQTLLRRLSVFAGGCTLEAIEAVCADGLPDVMAQLGELVDHSSIRREVQHDGMPRFRMQEVVREYAHELLESSDESLAVRRGHAAYYLQLSELAAKEGFVGTDQAAWMARLAVEEGNLGAALEFTIDHQDAETALRLGGNLWPFWARQGHLWEGRMWLERALAIGDDAPTPARARALHRLGNLAIDLTDFPRAQSLFEASLDLSRGLDDQNGIVIALNGLALVAGIRGDYDEARALHETNLAAWRTLGDRRREAITLHNLGDVANAIGRSDEARARHREALAIQQDIGDVGSIAYSMLSLAETACSAGEVETALPMFERSLVLFEDVGDQLGIAFARYGLGRVANLRHETARALEQFAEAIALWRQFGDRRATIDCIEELAGVALAFGELEQAARLFGATAAARIALGVPIAPVNRLAIEANVETLRRALGNAVFANTWTVGQVITIEQAAVEAANMAVALRDRDS